MATNAKAATRFEAAVAAHRRGELRCAERLYREALALDPAHAAACNNLGLCAADAGRLSEAAGWFRRARACDPGSADAAVNLAQVLQQSGQAEAALAAWREAAALRPQQMEPALAAAALAAGLGRLDDAIDDLARAAVRRPQRDATRGQLVDHIGTLASACVARGDRARGHRLSALLVRLVPHDGDAIRLLEDCLRHARITRHDDTLRDDLLHYFRSDAVEHHELSRVACELLALRYAPPSDGGGTLAAWAGAGALDDELLELLLTRGRVASAAMERALTALRRAVARTVRDGALPDDWHRLAAALALQCYTNEYVFTVTGEERACCASFEARLARDPGDRDALLAIACYRAPESLAAQPAAPVPPAPPLLAELWRRTVDEPCEERALRRRLAPAATLDAVSAAVRGHYEESPYPRWQNLERQPPQDIAAYLRGELPHFAPGAGLAGAAAILVAGCGTGKHALRVAVRHPMCAVTAIDLSTASLAYGMRKAAELGIGNVAFAHRDLLGVTARDGPYQLIESVGVLHHLRDPAAGLAALCTALADDGVIKLGLYARHARRIVRAARRRIAELGLAATPADMRAFRERILDGAEPGLEPLLESLDFYAMSAVRDLLFHVQEHQFDAPQLAALLAGCGLRCIGFQVAPTTRRRYRERFAHDPAMADLGHWAALEDEFPDTFAGMYQFWCVRDR